MSIAGITSNLHSNYKRDFSVKKTNTHFDDILNESVKSTKTGKSKSQADTIQTSASKLTQGQKDYLKSKYDLDNPLINKEALMKDLYKMNVISKDDLDFYSNSAPILKVNLDDTEKIKRVDEDVLNPYKYFSKLAKIEAGYANESAAPDPLLDKYAKMYDRLANILDEIFN